MLQIYNGKFALLLLLRETSLAVLSSSSMWVHSINKDREAHGDILSYLLEYVFISIVICHHIYWNMLSYLLEYVIIFIGICYHIYWNMLSYNYWNMSSFLLEYAIIFIGICHHIYLLLNSNSDKNYIQNITSVKYE